MSAPTPEGDLWHVRLYAQGFPLERQPPDQQAIVALLAEVDRLREGIAEISDEWDRGAEPHPTDKAHQRGFNAALGYCRARILDLLNPTEGEK